MNDAKTLAEIKRLARRDRIVITPHAERRMQERGVTRPDVIRALLTATIALEQLDHYNWRVMGGVDIDGDELMVICDVEADDVVVTVF